MNKKILSILLALIFVLGFARISLADTGAFADFNTQYPGTSYGCTLCHTSPPTTNPYGAALVAQGAMATNITPAMFVAVEGLDSDGDGFSNIDEINAGTLPGDPTSFPSFPPPDTTAPVVTAFSIPSASSSLTVTITNLEATDAVGVTGYLVTESPTKPTAGAAGWSGTKPTSYTFGSEGSKTLYAWAKDAAGNVSDGIMSASVVITLPFEVTNPAAGESVPTGAAYAVTWTAATGAASYKVKLSIDGGLTWSTLGTGLSATTTSWNVPTTIKKNVTNAIIKVIAYNGNNIKLEVAKSGTFSIDVLTITAPVAAEVVPQSSTYTITWTANGTAATPDSVVVKYTLNNGSTWKTAQGTLAPDMSSFSWSVPAVSKPKNKAKVKVTLKVAGVTVANAVSAKFTVQ